MPIATFATDEDRDLPSLSDAQFATDGRKERSREPSPSASHVREKNRASETEFSMTKAEAMEAHDDDTLLTPSEVAAMFRVNPKTVTRWARAGKISAVRTLGGHRRFRASEIRHFLDTVDEADI
jgi:excisionase family DNA binding protein